MDGAEAKPPATWRPLILWSAAIVLALALAWFVGAVVIPAYQVHSTIRNIHAILYRPTSEPLNVAPLVKVLGGPERAAWKLSIYLRLPKKLICRSRPPPDDERAIAIELLAACGKPGVGPLIRELKHPEPDMRKLAASALGRIGPEAREAVPVLIQALSDTAAGESSAYQAPDPVCCVAAEALGKIGPDAEAALPALEKLLSDGSWGKEAAAAAIVKIRGKPPE
jgi:hypothetical protein